MKGILSFIHEFRAHAKWKMIMAIAVAFAIIGSGCDSAVPTGNINTKSENIIEEKSSSEDSKASTDAKAADTKNEKGNNSKSTSVKGELKVHFIDVGQADAILLQQGNAAMLIDGGNNGDRTKVKNYIEQEKITQLDYVIGTHAHEDHIGGLDYVINAFKVGKVYFPRQSASTKTFEDFTIAVKSKVGKLTAPKVGDTFKLGEAVCTILGPNGSDYGDANDYSIVIKVVYGSTSFLFTGDAEERSESEMLSSGMDLSATVLKVGHHGSRTSTGQEFLNKVNPRYAVISVGEVNSYGHPTQDALDRLKAKKIPVYRTDENGTIVAVSDGKKVSFSTKPGSYKGVISDAETSSEGKSKDSANKASASKGSTSGTNTSGSKVAGTGAVSSQKAAVPSSNRIVYFTKSGGSYHYDESCRAFRKSSIVLSGSLKQAIAGKHSDPCDFCVPQ
jgi:competence protein ComEC